MVLLQRFPQHGRQASQNAFADYRRVIPAFEREENSSFAVLACKSNQLGSDGVEAVGRNLEPGQRVAPVRIEPR